MDNTGCYINRFCLSWTILVGKSLCFVCCEQYWLLYIPGLCAMNKTGWYITRFCPLWTIMVGISPSFFLSWTKLGWYINRFCLSWTKIVGISTATIIVHNGHNRVIYQPVLFMAHKPGIYNNQYCSRQTKQGDLPTIIVHDRQNWLI